MESNAGLNETEQFYKEDILEAHHNMLVRLRFLYLHYLEFMH
jgi:hypothetical protein